MFEPYAIIVSLIALGISWRAYLLSKRGIEIQTEAHNFQVSDLAARQEPKIQISNETFLSSWQIESSLPRCKPNEIELHYSAVASNKGESVVLLESVAIEIGPANESLEDAEHSLGNPIVGPVYIAAGESISLQCRIAEKTIELVRLFFQKPHSVLVFTLVFKYCGYAGQTRIRRTEIYRMTSEGGIVSKGNYNAAEGLPRSYLLSDTLPK